MRYLLLFLLMLPSVSAVAVTPTSLDFGGVSRVETTVREVLIVNTLDFPVEYHVSGMYEDRFVLLPKEKRVMNVTLRADVDDGMYEDVLQIEEVYGGNLLQGITLPVTYTVRGGDFSDTKFDFAALRINDAETLSKYILLTGGLLGLGIYGWRRKKSFK